MRHATEGKERGRIVLRAENLWRATTRDVTVLKGVNCEVFEGQDCGALRAIGLRQEHAASSFWRTRLPDSGLVLVNGVEVNRRSNLCVFCATKWGSCFNFII